MRFGDSEADVNISASREAYQGGATGPDIFVSVEVRVSGFLATIGTVVARRDWETFVVAVSNLDERRRGDALLQSADDRELRLRICNADRAGHMAVSGEIGRPDIYGEPRFTFERIPFDPTLLPQLVAELRAIGV
jgi:hypothetical protein